MRDLYSKDSLEEVAAEEAALRVKALPEEGTEAGLLIVLFTFADSTVRGFVLSLSALDLRFIEPREDEGSESLPVRPR